MIAQPPLRRCDKELAKNPAADWEIDKIHLAGAAYCPVFYPKHRFPDPGKGSQGGAPRRGFPMNVETILRNKGREVATIRPGETVEAAIGTLISRNIGALVASEDGARVDGIISERDIVHALARLGTRLLSSTVAEVMTRPVVTCDPAKSVAELMAEMTNRRIRHLPVVQGGRLCGIVSIGDLVKHRLDEIEYEANSLRSFIASA
jgi:CBS domain-containing protein